MSPDDPAGTREYRFNYDKHHHVIIRASRDGSGSIEIFDSLMQPAAPDICLGASKDAVKMLSIARRIAFEEYKRRGGTIEGLHEDEED